MLRLLPILLVIYGCQAQLQNKRFEYKHSFKGPHLVQKDRTVPFWTYVGNAIASDDFVRLAPSLKSQRGLIWNKIGTEFDNWEVELTFKIAGRGRVGADGLAFWYTMDNEGLTGPVFGSRDRWNGLGVFFDSFDNDAQNNNPYISAQVNDGTRNFDHQTDGSQHALGGCMRDYRNKPYPVKAKIRYEKNVLTVSTNLGLSRNTGQDDDGWYEPCFVAHNVILQRGGHFVVSAATGGIADDHDILGFSAHSIRSEEEMKSKQIIADDEKEKLQKEYEQYDKQLNEAKDEYQKENPEVKEPENQEYFDNDVQELRMIFEGQDHIHQAINGINRRINEMLGLAQTLSSQVSQIQNNQGAVQGGQPAPAQPAGAGTQSNIQRHEVDHLIRSSNDITLQINNLKAAMDTLSRERRDAPAAAAPFADKNQQHQIADTMAEVKTIVKQMQATQYANGQQGGGGRAATDCPTPNCASATHLIGLACLQVLLIGLYTLYTSRREAAAKKFY